MDTRSTYTGARRAASAGRHASLKSSSGSTPGCAQAPHITGYKSKRERLGPESALQQHLRALLTPYFKNGVPALLPVQPGRPVQALFMPVGSLQRASRGGGGARLRQQAPVGEGEVQAAARERQALGHLAGLLALALRRSVPSGAAIAASAPHASDGRLQGRKSDVAGVRATLTMAHHAQTSSH